MSNQLTVIQEQFYSPIKSQFTKISDEKTFRKEVSFAIQALKKNPYLQRCDANSVMDSVLNVSQTGLTLNPVLNYAYLVPHKGKCVLYPSYQGLCKLATDTGAIKSIECHLIYEGDEILIDLATEEKIKKHIPYFLNSKDKGDIIAGYSIATLEGGQRHIEFMSKQQILDIREYSESYKAYKNGKMKSCVWTDNPSEMYRKTIVKRHFKYLPKSHVPESMQKAIELDNKDYDFPASFEQGSYIESLLMNAAIPEKVEREIHQSLHRGEFTQQRAKECIEYLKKNQVDPISSGNKYNMTDVKTKLSNEK